MVMLYMQKGGISNTKMVNKEHVEGFLGRRKYSMAIKDYSALVG